MNLAKRVRDCRYAKGWGPDELASRAEISRTALYQIECGKTETPRAGTLRRIAEALDVPIDALISGNVPARRDRPSPAPAAEPMGRRPRLLEDRAPEWDEADEDELAPAGRGVSARRREVERMFRELLDSPLCESIARIVEESHRLLPARTSRRSI